MHKPVRLSRRTAIAAAVAAVVAAGTAGAVGLAGFADASPSAASSASVSRHAHPASCGAATLRGTYLFQGNGWSLSSGTAKPVAFAGADHFDGAGHIRGNSTASINGVISRSAFTGTYRLARNCTGTFTIGTTLHFDLYPSPGGSAFTYIETDRGSVSAATGQRATRG